MYKAKAKRRFKKYFLEALLKGVKAETASDEAMTKVKAEMQAMFSADQSLSDVKKQRLWFVMYDELVDWQLMLADLPLDNPQSLAEIPQILARMKDPEHTIQGPGITEMSKQVIDGDEPVID